MKANHSLCGGAFLHFGALKAAPGLLDAVAARCKLIYSGETIKTIKRCYGTVNKAGPSEGEIKPEGGQIKQGRQRGNHKRIFREGHRRGARFQTFSARAAHSPRLSCLFSFYLSICRAADGPLNDSTCVRHRRGPVVPPRRLQHDGSMAVVSPPIPAREQRNSTPNPAHLRRDAPRLERTRWRGRGGAPGRPGILTAVARTARMGPDGAGWGGPVH